MIDRDFEVFRYMYHCEARVNGASYISCLDLAQNHAGKEKNSRTTFPIKNPYVNLFCKVKNLHFILSGKLLEARSAYPKREEEAFFALFAEFSLKELIAVFDEELFLLNRCNGLNSLFDLSEAFTAAFSPEIAMFETIIEFFYTNRFLI